MFEHIWEFWRNNTRHRHPAMVALESEMITLNKEHLEALKNGRLDDDPLPGGRHLTDGVVKAFRQHIQRKGLKEEDFEKMVVDRKSRRLLHLED